MEGWAGKILDIDLTTGEHKDVPLDMEMARLFLGGRGLGARLLWDLVGPEVEPLSPENVLIFTTGPITASSAQTSNRFSVSAKSPLTEFHTPCQQRRLVGHAVQAHRLRCPHRAWQGGKAGHDRNHGGWCGH